MRLDVLTLDNCETVRHWRNDDIGHLRTPYFLTKEMQEDFYKDVICNRNSHARFWGVIDGEFSGIVGLVNISLENRSAEISVILDPDKRGQGLGIEAINTLLQKGFYELNLDNIYGECYENSAHIRFWEKYCESHQVEVYPLPRRKYYNGLYYDSIYFNFTKEDIC